MSAAAPALEPASTLVEYAGRMFDVDLARVPGGAWLIVRDVDLVYAHGAPALPIDVCGRLCGSPSSPVTADYLVVAGIALARLIPQEPDQ